MGEKIILQLQKRNQPRKYIYDYIATVLHHDNTTSYKFGGAVSCIKENAKVRAIHEALERFGGSIITKNILHTSIIELKKQGIGYIDPSVLAPFSKQQLSQTDFRFHSIQEKDVIGWVLKHNKLQPIAIPARAVFLGYKNREEIVYMPTSSCGLAIHKTRLLAKMNAIKELFERDAAMLVWLKGISPNIINLSNIINPHLKILVNACKDENIKLVICDATNDTQIQSYIALTISDEYPRVTFGLSTDLDEESGILKAIEEAMMIRNSLEIMRIANPEHKISAKDEIFTFMDHALYYADGKDEQAWGFLLSGKIRNIKPPSRVPVELLFKVDELRWGISCLDITPKLFDGLNVKLVRSISTKLYPMNIRHDAPYLASSRLLNISVNQYPHPFA